MGVASTGRPCSSTRSILAIVVSRCTRSAGLVRVEADGDELRTSSSPQTRAAHVPRARGYEVDAESDDTIHHLTELDSLAEPAVPDGYRLRTVEPADLEQRVEIHRAVWAPSRVTAESFANVQAAWPYP